MAIRVDRLRYEAAGGRATSTVRIGDRDAARYVVNVFNSIRLHPYIVHCDNVPVKFVSAF